MEDNKNSIKIEFVDYNGDTHIFYNERLSKDNNQVEFVGVNLGRFLKSLGWSKELIIEDTIDYLSNEIE